MPPRLCDVAIGAAAACAVAYALKFRQTKLRGGVYYGDMIKAKREHIEQYMAMHDHTWDEVMDRMYKSNMRDFMVWLHEESMTMFHSFCYVGDDFEADMAAIAADPITRFWWSYCEPCQQPLHWTGAPPSQGGAGDPSFKGQWWSPLKLVTHTGAWATAWANELGPNPSYKPCHPRGLLTTKDNTPPLHNRPPSWTSYAQAPFEAGR